MGLLRPGPRNRLTFAIADASPPCGGKGEVPPKTPSERLVPSSRSVVGQDADSRRAYAASRTSWDRALMVRTYGSALNREIVEFSPALL